MVRDGRSARGQLARAWLRRGVPISAAAAAAMAAAIGWSPSAARPASRHAGPTPVAAQAHDWHYDRARAWGRPSRTAMRSAFEQLAPQARGQAPLAPAGLPITWCGQPLAAGRLAPNTTHVFQLVYAHPADQPDRLAMFANLLQADASYIDRFIAAESGGTEYMRFAMGTSCGPQYVSLIDWAMPQARAAYTAAADPGTANFTAIDSDAIGTFGRAAGVDTLVYVDGLVQPPSWSGDTYGGVAEGLAIGDTRPGPENTNNAGGQFAFLFGVVGGQPIPGDEALDPPTLLHEASHAIGAVGPGAPNSTGAGHCYVVKDIMCYADGGSAGQPSNLQSVCGWRHDVMQVPYDCTGENYFSPSPAPGSYLATHWNLYNSTFMAPCPGNAAACGAAQPPVGQTTGRGRMRLTLTATTLSNGSVSVVAGISGLPGRVNSTVCLRSPAFYPSQPACGTTRARAAAHVATGTLAAADGEGWRSVVATARVAKSATALAGQADAPLRTSVRLP